MEEVILEAELRKDTGRIGVTRLRREGFIPAVIYGEGRSSEAIKLSAHSFLHLLHEQRLENAILTLKIKNAKKAQKKACLIKEIQYHPVHGNILHVDFYEVSLTKAIKVNVPVVTKGEAQGVKQDGGSLEHILWEIEVECLPTNIPKQIEVDVTSLKIGDSLHVKDLTIPENVKVLNDPEATVVAVSAPVKEEVAVEAVEGESPAEPEVIKEKKEKPAESEEKDEAEKQK